MRKVELYQNQESIERLAEELKQNLEDVIETRKPDELELFYLPHDDRKIRIAPPFSELLAQTPLGKAPSDQEDVVLRDGAIRLVLKNFPQIPGYGLIVQPHIPEPQEDNYRHISLNYILRRKEPQVPDLTAI